VSLAESFPFPGSSEGFPLGVFMSKEMTAFPLELAFSSFKRLPHQKEVKFVCLDEREHIRMIGI